MQKNQSQFLDLASARQAGRGLAFSLVAWSLAQILVASVVATWQWMQSSSPCLAGEWGDSRQLVQLLSDILLYPMFPFLEELCCSHWNPDFPEFVRVVGFPVAVIGLIWNGVLWSVVGHLVTYSLIYSVK